MNGLSLKRGDRYQCYRVGRLVMFCHFGAEVSFGNLDLPKSMDITVGLKSDDTLQKEMLLVDFKFNVENPTRIRKIDMLEKVEHSSLLLGTHIRIREEYIFVLKTTKVQEAKRWFSRYHDKIPQTYIAMDINTLKATYF